MNQDIDRVEDQRKALPLKQPEPEVCLEKPWQDDVLNRKEVADRLTSVVRNQTLPFVISIHGEWGTGKTFMLKRWQKDLEKRGFKAIYFNAWEDDFCDDPLLAILGQLWDYFKDDQGDKLRGLFKKIRANAGPILRANINSLLLKHAGLTTETSQAKEVTRDLISEYLNQANTKDTLKENLCEMAEAVQKETRRPLVFIIDELDRCRPTFAIELLERVKHIFDVPNMVFVLGINRDELCKSLQSVYGEIDADVYLRRFFDLEFNLAAVDTAEYCRYLMRKLGISDLFHELGKNDLSRTLQNEVQQYFGFFPELWSNLGMSLRDMDYCMRSIALVGNCINRDSRTIPWILGLLISLKLKNPNLYRRYIRHECLSSEVIDYIHDNLPSRDTLAIYLIKSMDKMEGYLYCAESNSPRLNGKGSNSIEQLKLLQKRESLTHREYLSCLTRQIGSDRAEDLLEITVDAYYEGAYGDVVGSLGQVIDLHQIRR